MSKPLVTPALLRALARPIQAFFRLEVAGGIVLLGAAAAALAWANSPAAPLYRALFEGPLAVGLFGGGAHLSLNAIINDGLMAIFFFVVGMEIKRELVLGELRSVRRALLPAIAALGGMVVPAAIYFFFNRGTPGARGWAIPMATDIAFSIGVLTLLKGRVSHALIVFLTALAIFDDLGGILVIAIFYGSGLQPLWLLAAAAALTVAFALGARGARAGALYLGLGAILWIAVHQAGIHATIAGVLLGLAIPARARTHDNLEAPLARFIRLLHPWVAFGIVPLFALANSGVDLSATSAADLLEPVCLGAAAGLFFGKQVGIFAFTIAAVRFGFASSPGGARAVDLYGVAIVGGIGFTVALFIAGLAFPDPRLLAQAKLGILIGSLVAGVVGFVWLRLLGREPARVGPPAAR